jgi:exopolysaccharide biosynthesis protein
MKKTFAPLCFILLLAGQLFAQDSLTVVEAKWITKRIAPGIKLKQHWFTNNSLFNSNQYINILEIKPKRKTQLDLGFEAKEKKRTSEFGKEGNAIAALNGTFFDVANGGSVDFIKSDGTVINENRAEKNGNRALHQKAALIFKNGKLSIAKWDGTEDWEKKLEGEDIMLSGPLLLINEQAEKLDSVGFNVTRHPRTAIARTSNNRILLITVDGRNENSAGMNLFELSKFLKWINSSDGINLDGGGSSALWVKGKKIEGVVNHPSDNKKWDHEGERKVANVVLVKRK